MNRKPAKISCCFNGSRPLAAKYLFNNLFKVDTFTKIQYTYIHKISQTNWLIKVSYTILQKKSGNLLIKTKEKEKKVKQFCDVS